LGMEEGVIHFINQLSPSDSAEIVKFDSAVEVVQPFVAGDDSGKALLIDKVEEAWDYGRSTRLYDAIYQAVEDLSFQHDARRAVILLTDGVEYINEGDATSEHTFFEVKNYAISTGVPVFTIGIGTGVDEEGINSLANDTGGQYFDTLLAGHLSTIYQQLAQILFVDQYLLICDSVFTSGDSVILNARVTLSEGGIGEDSRTILPCP
ncbi:MAG: VWA domain-containing protein, partial [Desulfuromonadales bacterium]|nr:VWA domain-containing protein [Desulfuromonadales bacterium]